MPRTPSQPPQNVGLARIIELAEFGELHIDIAFGGNFFAMLPAEKIGVPVHPENYSALVEIGTGPGKRYEDYGFQHLLVCSEYLRSFMQTHSDLPCHLITNGERFSGTIHSAKCRRRKCLIAISHKLATLA